MTDELRAVGERFAIAGRFDERPGLSAAATSTRPSSRAGKRGGDRVRYVHQRFNTRVFSDPALVMENIARVTAHLRAALARRGVRDLERRVLTLVPARDGRPFVVAPEGGVWRTFLLDRGHRHPRDHRRARGGLRGGARLRGVRGPARGSARAAARGHASPASTIWASASAISRPPSRATPAGAQPACAPRSRRPARPTPM